METKMRVLDDALELMAESAFDVVVSDMRMPAAFHFALEQEANLLDGAIKEATALASGAHSTQAAVRPQSATATQMEGEGLYE